MIQAQTAHRNRSAPSHPASQPQSHPASYEDRAAPASSASTPVSPYAPSIRVESKEKSSLPAPPSPPSNRYAAPTYQLSPPPPLPSRTVQIQPKKEPKAVQPARMQIGSDDYEEIEVRLEPPGPELLFRLESEEDLQERIRQERKQRGATVEPDDGFPPPEVLSKTPYEPREFEPRRMEIEPSYVCYRRLLFEDLNHERYGWDYGFFQPLISTGRFYKDVAFIPHKLTSRPCQRTVCNTGYCLPGDPTPYLIYPPELTATGLMGEAGVIIAGFAIFP